MFDPGLWILSGVALDQQGCDGFHWNQEVCNVATGSLRIETRLSRIIKLLDAQRNISVIGAQSTH